MAGNGMEQNIKEYIESKGYYIGKCRTPSHNYTPRHPDSVRQGCIKCGYPRNHWVHGQSAEKTVN